ncbi:hypothetical protein [uncultured Deinococcus sp.]|uniref:hypothetical protein n=1 Tax=uncultured Deinococcus sp. TaxID=158789 RepID=UPI002590FDB5|nr:hypothetical protein [uncultured Deinococcus sp.]
MEVIDQAGGVRRAGIIRLDKNTVGEMSKWLKMVSQAIYFLKYEKAMSGDWEMFPINPVGVDQVKYFDEIIVLTEESISMGNSSQAWGLHGAFSEDGVMLFRIEFNSIIQFVVAIHKTKTSLISQYAAVGY